MFRAPRSQVAAIVNRPRESEDRFRRLPHVANAEPKNAKALWSRNQQRKEIEDDLAGVSSRNRKAKTIFSRVNNAKRHTQNECQPNKQFCDCNQELQGKNHGASRT